MIPYQSIMPSLGSASDVTTPSPLAAKPSTSTPHEVSETPPSKKVRFGSPELPTLLHMDTSPASTSALDEDTPPPSQMSVSRYGSTRVTKDPSPLNNLKFPPLHRDVLQKIRGIGPNQQAMPKKSFLPADNNRWFHWWAASHPLVLGSRMSVQSCIHDARIDGVLPKSSVSFEPFIAQKLKNINKSIKADLQSALNLN